MSPVRTLRSPLLRRMAMASAALALLSLGGCVAYPGYYGGYAPYYGGYYAPGYAYGPPVVDGGVIIGGGGWGGGGWHGGGWHGGGGWHR